MAGGKGGRPRKPDGLKVIEGTARKDRINEEAPEFGIDLEVPPWLNDEERAAWFDIVPMLIRANVVTEGDTIILTQLVKKYVEWKKLTDMVADQGYAVDGAQGGIVGNPTARFCNQAYDQLMKTLIEFGMTPAARSKVRAPKAGDKPSDNMFGALKGKR